MKSELLLIFLCPYTGILLFSAVHVNSNYVAPQSLAKTELASRPYYEAVALTYEIMQESEARKPTIQNLSS
jgi:hypothetical protein